MKTVVHSITNILTVIVLIGVLFSFSKDQKRDDKAQFHPLILQEVEKKLQKYRETILEKCKEEALNNAHNYVDSIVAEEIKLLSSDTLIFPRKPERPGLPEKIILDDSTRIKPIIEN